MSTPLVFSPVSPAQFARLGRQAQESGIEISGNSGSAARLGVEVSWSYDPGAGRLTLECLRAPFFLSRADVETRLRNLVQQALAGA